MDKINIDVAIIGGGAAGFFAALSASFHFPNAQIHIFEKNRTVLNKVRISGGGRCNVTNGAKTISLLVKGYPRGGDFLKNLFPVFNNQHLIDWFMQRDVPLKIEADGRVFPISDSSESIIDCFLKEAKKSNIAIHTSKGVVDVQQINDLWQVTLQDNSQIWAKKVIITTGGNPSIRAYDWLANLGHTIATPVPSLFTFNAPASPIKDLQGISVNNGSVRIAGTKEMQEGPVLVTHWGFSGPAVLKLSAWQARQLADKNYSFSLTINWLSPLKEDKVRQQLQDFKALHYKKLVHTLPLQGIPHRLWESLCQLAQIPTTLRWAELPQKNLNKLIENLVNQVVPIEGKTTFKDEFVTCGGISLQDIVPHTLESKICKGLFFAGEVLDIDGITGGYNFQAAWTTAWIAGKLVS
jgi:predicted Rossmann fold flavoprotein